MIPVHHTGTDPDCPGCRVVRRRGAVVLTLVVVLVLAVIGWAAYAPAQKIECLSDECILPIGVTLTVGIKAMTIEDIGGGWMEITKEMTDGGIIRETWCADDRCRT